MSTAAAHRRFQGQQSNSILRLLSQDAFRLHVCPRSWSDRSVSGSAADVNCRPLEEDLSNHYMAGGMWVCHEHRLRPKANRKWLPSGSVIFSLHSAVNVLRCFINGFTTLRQFAQCKNIIFLSVMTAIPSRIQVNTIMIVLKCECRLRFFKKKKKRPKFLQDIKGIYLIFHFRRGWAGVEGWWNVPCLPYLLFNYSSCFQWEEKPADTLPSLNLEKAAAPPLPICLHDVKPATGYWLFTHENVDGAKPRESAGSRSSSLIYAIGFISRQWSARRLSQMHSDLPSSGTGEEGRQTPKPSY